MHCGDSKVLGLAAQWSFWAMLEMEALLLELLNHRAVLPEFARDASYAERDELLLSKPLGVLHDTLAERDHLADGQFSVADLNVASILVWGKMGRLDLRLILRSHDGWTAVWRGPVTVACVIGRGKSKPGAGFPVNVSFPQVRTCRRTYVKPQCARTGCEQVQQKSTVRFCLYGQSRSPLQLRGPFFAGGVDLEQVGESAKVKQLVHFVG
jgi:hypothetical protein